MSLVQGKTRSAEVNPSLCTMDTPEKSLSDLPTSCESLVATPPTCSSVGPPPCLAPAPPIGSLPDLNLNEEELAKIRDLRAIVDSLPIVDEPIDTTPIDEQERGWFSGLFNRSSSNLGKGDVTALTWDEVLWLANDMVLFRYLRSYSWDEVQAQKQLLQTVWWRRHRRPQHVRPEAVMSTAARGSVYRRGFDVYGHPIVYFK